MFTQIRWAGFTKNDESWEPEDNINDTVQYETYIRQLEDKERERCVHGIVVYVLAYASSGRTPSLAWHFDLLMVCGDHMILSKGQSICRYLSHLRAANDPPIVKVIAHIKRNQFYQYKVCCANGSEPFIDYSAVRKNNSKDNKCTSYVCNKEAA
jgi:hypothetical protein